MHFVRFVMSRSAVFHFILVILALHGTEGQRDPIENCEAFNGNPSSTKLDFSSRNIPILRAECLQNFNEVETLILNNCKIEKIEQNAFSKMEKLEHVYLSNNLLSSLPENLFEHNKNLKVVSLKNNEFEAVPFIGVPLAELELSRNKITSLSLPDDIKVLKLDLSYNRLESVTSQELESLRKVATVRFNNNPWRCGHEFSDFLCWSLRRPDGPAEIIPVKCSTGKGYFISYSSSRLQEMCNVKLETVASHFPTFFESQNQMYISNTGDTFTEKRIGENSFRLTEDQSDFGDVTSDSNAPFQEKNSRILSPKSRSEINREYGLEEEDSEAENIKRWKVIAFIGLMCTAVAFSILMYIMYAYKLTFARPYNKIDNDSQGP